MSISEYKTGAVILAAGSGSRMNMDKTKQRLLLCGKSVLRHSLEAYEAASSVDSIVIVSRADELEFARIESQNISKVKNIIIGGKTRAESAKCGFYEISQTVDFVAFHDAARCLVTPEEIDSVVFAAHAHGAATASTKVTDTVKECDADGKILRTVPRENLRAVQTPQVFDKALYKSALDEVSDCGITITDDNMLVEKTGFKVFAVDTSSENIKITTSADIALAEFIISKRHKQI